jgi:pimeloyl-ACP methyl ester carboxylesterase
MPERVIPSGDVRIWAEDIGSPDGQPLLLVMGANASSEIWPDEFVALLAGGGCRVIRYDHRDTGRSTCRDFGAHPYSVADLAGDALAVLDGFDLAGAHVVGLSMGGTIGQLLALDHRERLRSLTLMLTAALDVDFVGNIRRAMSGEPSPDGLPVPDRHVLEVLFRRAEPVAGREAELDRRVAEWRALSGPALPFDAAGFRRWEERAMAHAGTHVQSSIHGLATPVPTSRGAELGGVTTPTLVIQGELDPLNPPPHGRHLAELIPGARLAEVPGLGHALPGAVHRTIAGLVLEHVKRNTIGRKDAQKAQRN